MEKNTNNDWGESKISFEEVNINKISWQKALNMFATADIAIVTTLTGLMASLKASTPFIVHSDDRTLLSVIDWIMGNKSIEQDESKIGVRAQIIAEEEQYYNELFAWVSKQPKWLPRKLKTKQKSWISHAQ